MNAEEFEKLLIELRACAPARKWAKGKSFLEIWETCDRADWLLWLCGRMVGREGWPDHKAIVGVACDCAELALPYVAKGENRPAECIATVRRWIAGDASIDDVNVAYDAAGAAYAADAADADAAYVAGAAGAAYAAAAYAAAAAADAYAAAAAGAAGAAGAAYAAAAAAAGAAYAAADADAAYVAGAAGAAYAAAAAAAAGAAYAAADAAARTDMHSKCCAIIRAKLRPAMLDRCEK